MWIMDLMFSFLFLAMSLVPQPIAAPEEHLAIALPSSKPTATTVSSIPQVPFYSQFADVQSPKWQKVSCGVASLAMVIDYYKPAVSVETLLKAGIAAGAYDPNAGWTYKGLIGLSNSYGLKGASYDLGKSTTDAAFTSFKSYLKDGPVIASIHYKFDPKSTIPHLVVINAIKDGVVYYNDPAATSGGKTISTTDFLKAWKKRFIVIRPKTAVIAIAQ